LGWLKSGRLRWKSCNLGHRQPLGHLSRASDSEHGGAQPADDDCPAAGNPLSAVVEPRSRQARAAPRHVRCLTDLTCPEAESSDGPVRPGRQHQHLVRHRPRPAGAIEPAPAHVLCESGRLVGLLAGLLRRAQMVDARPPGQAHDLVAEDRPHRSAQSHLGRRLCQDRRPGRAGRRSNRTRPGRLARPQPEAEHEPEQGSWRIQRAEHRGL